MKTWILLGREITNLQGKLKIVRKIGVFKKSGVNYSVRLKIGNRLLIRVTGRLKNWGFEKLRFHCNSKTECRVLNRKILRFQMCISAGSRHCFTIFTNTSVQLSSWCFEMRWNSLSWAKLQNTPQLTPSLNLLLLVNIYSSTAGLRTTVALQLNT